jgi:hypothetical protein
MRSMLLVAMALGGLSVFVACTTNVASSGDAGPDAEVADATADATADVHADSEVSDGGSDSDAAVSCESLAPNAASCKSPCTIRYETPGCGAAAHPVCGSGAEDACLGYVCSCTGQAIVKCDYATEPWASYGACDGGDAAAD